jgi:hypothetical protein
MRRSPEGDPRELAELPRSADQASGFAGRHIDDPQVRPLVVPVHDSCVVFVLLLLLLVVGLRLRREKCDRPAVRRPLEALDRALALRQSPGFAARAVQQIDLRLPVAVR